MLNGDRAGRVLDTHLAIATRCPDCDQVVEKEFTLFRLRKGSMAVACDCGARVAEVRSRREYVHLCISCHICGEDHCLTARRGYLLQDPLLHVACSYTDIEVAVLARPGAALAEIERLETFPEDPWSEESDEYFVNPDVMYDVLDHLQDLSEAGQIQCPCGNTRLDFEVVPDAINLNCEECGKSYTVPAQDETDLERLRTDRPEWLKSREKPGVSHISLVRPHK